MVHQPLGYTHPSYTTSEESPLAQIGYQSLISPDEKTRIRSTYFEDCRTWRRKSRQRNCS